MDCHDEESRAASAPPRGYALLVPLRDGQQAVWDRRRDLLEARVVRDDGTVIGFVPLRVGCDASADEVAGMLAQQRYEHLSRTAAPAASPVQGDTPARTPVIGAKVHRQRGRRTRQMVVLAAVVLLIVLLLRLLAGRV